MNSTEKNIPSHGDYWREIHSTASGLLSLRYDELDTFETAQKADEVFDFAYERFYVGHKFVDQADGDFSFVDEYTRSPEAYSKRTGEAQGSQMTTIRARYSMAADVVHEFVILLTIRAARRIVRGEDNLTDKLFTLSRNYADRRAFSNEYACKATALADCQLEAQDLARVVDAVSELILKLRREVRREQSAAIEEKKRSAEREKTG